MQSKRAPQFLAFAFSISVLLNGSTSARGAQLDTLTGETLTGTATLTGTCEGVPATITFTATGTAAGPYPGTFTATGTVVYGAPLEVSSLREVLSFVETFEIISSGTTITGSKGTSITPGPGPGPGACLGPDTIEVAGTTDYKARIDSDKHKRNDKGRSFIIVGPGSFTEMFTSDKK